MVIEYYQSPFVWQLKIFGHQSCGNGKHSVANRAATKFFLITICMATKSFHSGFWSSDARWIDFHD
jgi:hypothetical protein